MRRPVPPTPDSAPAGAPGPTPGPAPGPAPGAPPSQAPASPAQMMLAQMFQVAKRMAQENPAMAAGMQKAAEGIQEAQTALLMQGPNPTPAENPPL